MPGVEKLHLEDAFEDAPQTRSLLGVFEADASLLQNYTSTMQKLCQQMLNAQRELCVATQGLAVHLKGFDKQNFPFESDDSVLSSTLGEFASYLDEVSSVHQVLATTLGDALLYPLNKSLQADLQEIDHMGEMLKMSRNDHEQAVGRYMKQSKKKEHDAKQRQESNEDLYVYRRKFHQTGLHYYSSLNALQYKRKTMLLEPLIGYMHAQRAFFQMGRETVNKPEVDEFLCNINASVQAVRTEMNQETQHMVDSIKSIEQASMPLYHADPPPDAPYFPNNSLTQKAGYLYVRSKQALISTRWDRCYLFVQGGNLMCQQKDEVAGCPIIDLNEGGLHAAPVDVEDRRFVFQIASPTSKKNVILQALNEREKDEWITTINNVSHDSRYSLPAVSPQRESVESPRHNSAGSFNFSGSIPVPKAVEAAREQSGARHIARSGPPPTPPSTPQDGGFFPEAPISFDITPREENKLFIAGNKEGPPTLAGDNLADTAAFSETFMVRFLGSMEVRSDRGEQLVHETIRQIMAARAIHNVFKMTESIMVVSSEALRLLEPSTKAVRTLFTLDDISFWAVHQENPRLFGFITRTKASSQADRPSFACHVFECNTSGEEICHAISTATQLAFQALMDVTEGGDLDERTAIDQQRAIEEDIKRRNAQQKAAAVASEKEDQSKVPIPTSDQSQTQDSDTKSEPLTTENSADQSQATESDKIVTESNSDSKKVETPDASDSTVENKEEDAEETSEA